MQDILHQIQDPVIVMANGVNPMDDKPREGYHQRVATVDSYLRGRNRIYVTVNAAIGPNHHVRRLGDDCFELEIGDQPSTAVLQLYRRAIPIYSHSIFPLAHPQIRDLINSRGGKFIVDMHGVVPEETAFMGDKEYAQVLDQLESWAVLEADIRIYVTRRMSSHFKKKYPWSKGINIVCPIFPEAQKGKRVAKQPNGTVVYAGGAQAWQMVDRIVEAVHKSLSMYTAKILTHEPEIFRQKFIARGCSIDDARLSIYAARPADVRTVYSESSYGILCREPHILNRVACPTKLIEYLSFGLLPIMGTPEVGDFVDLGMQYARMEDLSECRLPVDDEYRNLVSSNFIVLDRLAELAERGRKQLLVAIS